MANITLNINECSTECLETFTFNYDTADIVEDRFSFFELEPDYDAYPLLKNTTLYATMYNGDESILPLTPNDDYYGGLSILKSDYLDVPIGDNVYTITATCGIFDAAWLLFLHDLGITDLEVDISMFTKLSALEIWKLNITSIVLPSTYYDAWGIYIYFEDCPNLTEVDFSVLPVLDSGFDNFQVSYCESCASIIPPNNGSLLTTVIIEDTAITSIDLSGITILYKSTGQFSIISNPHITSLILPDFADKVKWFFLTNNPLLGYVDISGLIGLTSVSGTSIYTARYRFNDNGYSAAIVNKILVDLDTISVGGYVYRYIYIDGTNTAPDNSSGGYDGLAAKSSLQGKGFTVITN